MGKAKHNGIQSGNEDAIPMFNTGYADKDGKLYYIYNAKIPKRDPRYEWNSARW